MTTKVFDRTQKSGIANAVAAGSDPAVFDSDGIAEVSNPDKYLAKFGGLELVGVPNLKVSLDVGGDATTTYTVPAGKQWRLLSCILEVTSDASVGNRNVTVTTPAGAIALANQAASTTTRSQIVFDKQTQGNLRVEPQGTLTIAEQVTAGDTMTINGQVFTFVAALSGAENEIVVGANEAATKANIEAAIGATPAAGNHSVTDATRTAMETTQSDFSGDDMTITYAGSGSATVDGEAIATTETFTHVSNVFDAATLGGTTAGAGAGTKEGTTTFPGNGVVLSATETVVIDEPTLSDSGDDIDIYLTYLEYDATIT